MSALTLQDYISGVQNKTIDPAQYLAEVFEKIKKNNLNAFVRLHEDYALAHIQDASLLPLAGAPIAIKDNIFTE